NLVSFNYKWRQSHLGRCGSDRGTSVRPHVQGNVSSHELVHECFVEITRIFVAEGINNAPYDFYLNQSTCRISCLDVILAGRQLKDWFYDQGTGSKHRFVKSKCRGKAQRKLDVSLSR